MARDTTPSPLPRSRGNALADDHLALVVADALAAVDARAAVDAGADAEPPLGTGADLRAAILYGWAIGAIGAREQAALAETDLGLRHLLGDAHPSFAEIRSFREANRTALEAELGMALAVCRAAGLARLGRIELPKHARILGLGTNRFVARVRKLLDEAESTDLHDDHEIGANARGDEVPPALAARGARQAMFRRLAAEGTGIRAPRRGVGVARALISAVATLALLLGGLVLIRWVGSANAEVTYSGQSRVPSSAPPAIAIATLEPPTPTPEALDLVAASQEGVRLGIMALADDDLQGARDFFFLASRALPENTVAVDHLRQVETALHVEQRTGGWTEALDDLGELRRLAPGAPSVLRAYVSGLVQAGRGALADGDPAQAALYCGEALRWLPSRTEAQTCLTAATRAATSQALPPTTTRTATPAPPTPVGTATATAAPGLEVSPIPTNVSGSERQGAGAALEVTVNAGCQPTLAGTRSIQAAGQVNADGAVPMGATVQVQIADAAGRVIDTSSFPIASPRFAVQRTIPGGGSHTVTVTATGAGYDSSEATARVSC
jgi:hypothetical protein